MKPNVVVLFLGRKVYYDLSELTTELRLRKIPLAPSEIKGFCTRAIKSLSKSLILNLNVEIAWMEVCSDLSDKIFLKYMCANITCYSAIKQLHCLI